MSKSFITMAKQHSFCFYLDKILSILKGGKKVLNDNSVLSDHSLLRGMNDFGAVYFL